MPFNPLDHSVYVSVPQRMKYSAWTEHVPFAMLLIDLVRPHMLVELGTHTGMSYCAFCQAIAELRLDTRAFAVDSWEGDDQAGFYGPEILADLRAHHDFRYITFSTLLQSTFDDANAIFADGSIDLLHIDGFHTYEAVRHDVDLWLPKMSATGVILLHDIAEHDETFGVWKLWEELKQAYPNHLEFLHGHGLGVVAVGETTPPELLELMRLPTEQWLSLRKLLAGLGANLRRQVDLERANQKAAEVEAQLERERAAWEGERDEWRQRQVAQQELAQREAQRDAQHIAETQRQLDSALWQLAWLNQSRGVRAIKLARASRSLLHERGPLFLAKRGALWLMGKRGYYQRDSAVAMPAPTVPPVLPAASEPPTASEPPAASKPHRETQIFKQVMFLSGCPGGAMRYRCDHQAEQLNLLGCSAESAAIGAVNLMELLDRFQCFVLHRVGYDAEIKVFMDEARQRGKPIFFDTDDLVFIPENAHYQSELERFSPEDRARYIDEMGRIRQTLTLSDAATVSTASLREWVAPLCEPVDVTPNALDCETVVRSAQALADLEARRSALSAAGEGDGAASEVVIGYLSGSPSHDRDFLEAQDAVLWALDTYPTVSLALHGPIAVSPEFDRFGARVRREEFRDWRELPTIYAGVTINLAPLERDNPFTETKSAIKYLEAGLLKVPTIASPRQGFIEVIHSGENGLLADTPEAWREALRLLIESPERRRTLGERAYADAIAHHTTPTLANVVFDTLRAHYRVVTQTRRADAPQRLRINWMIDSIGDGAQDESTAWLARALAERGHTVLLCVERDACIAGRDGSQSPCEVVVGFDQAPEADVSVATSAATAEIVARRPDSRFRFYLAPEADTFTSADERSFSLPLCQIGMGSSVARRMSEVSGVAALHLDAGAASGAKQVATAQRKRADAAIQMERILLDHCW